MQVNRPLKIVLMALIMDCESEKLLVNYNSLDYGLSIMVHDHILLSCRLQEEQ
jgi:hypothetical protein